MQQPKELVMYSRSTPCPFVSTARSVLKKYDVPYREFLIDKDVVYEQRVVTWTGFMSVPTLIIAEPGADLPYEPPAALAAGSSPRGIDRGSMLTEPDESQLVGWLQLHGLLTQIA